ncbi:MAG: SMC-Scp complex subunit ScpB [Actinobacteria bacterium]|nr:SMC-Scp complex subunit ScpB [Actinomycetota bacterium]
MNQNNNVWVKSCIEGILFISESPVSIKSIAEVIKIPEKDAEKIVKELEKEYLDKNGGFILRKAGGGYRFYSNPVINDVLKEFVKSNMSAYISQAALETLAIALYKQPVTRTQVAEIRGVRTDSVFQTLIDKRLIKEAGRLKEPGNPKIYRVTERLYEILGINGNSDLPPLKDFEEDEEK